MIPLDHPGMNEQLTQGCTSHICGPSTWAPTRVTSKRVFGEGFPVIRFSFFLPSHILHLRPLFLSPSPIDSRNSDPGSHSRLSRPLEQHDTLPSFIYRKKTSACTDGYRRYFLGKNSLPGSSATVRHGLINTLPQHSGKIRHEIARGTRHLGYSGYSPTNTPGTDTYPTENALGKKKLAYRIP